MNNEMAQKQLELAGLGAGPELYYKKNEELGEGPFGGTLLVTSSFTYIGGCVKEGLVRVTLSEGSNVLSGTSEKVSWLEEEEFNSLSSKLVSKVQEKFWANFEEELE